MAVEGGQASLSTVAVGLAGGDESGQGRDLINNLLIGFEALGDALAGMQDRGVVAAAEGLPDGGQ